MKRLLRRVSSSLAIFGIDLAKTARSLRGLPSYARDRRMLKRQMAESRGEFPFGRAYPCLEDRYLDSGTAKGHYFHQDLLVARRIHASNPRIHVDVGSSVEGFVAHVASFRPIEVFDIRPLSVSVPNIKFVQADLMATIPEEQVGYCDSLSCLHALEHFGLGRYGDPIDYAGHLRGLDNLGHMLQKGGSLYLSVPIGPQRIEFNAHRVFSVVYLLDLLAADYRLDRFSFVDDHGDLHEGVDMHATGIANSFGCTFGCGIFELTKL